MAIQAVNLWIQRFVSGLATIAVCGCMAESPVGHPARHDATESESRSGPDRLEGETTIVLSGAVGELVLSQGSVLTADGDAETIAVEKAIMAVGITGNIEDFGLEELGVQTDRGHIVVNEWNETSVNAVYAIGDVAGPPWLAHKASHEGVRCAERIAGLDGIEPVDLGNVPGCVYSAPDFTDQHLVINGASDLLHEIFGKEGDGYHARSALGFAALPTGAAVEVEAIFEIKE